MHAFLRNIADGYFRAEGIDLNRYTFIFPNSRSAKYFVHYLSQNKTFEGNDLKTIALTMAEFCEKGARLKRASQNKLLMTVYAAYCKVSREKNPEFTPEEFDRFRFWAEMLIKDFDEVDRYLVNPDELFRNVADYKEIQSFYLTEEQAKIIRNFWGDDPYWGRLAAPELKEAAEEIPFWAHIGQDSHAPVRKFKQIWEMLGEIYREVTRMLLAEKLCYPGLAERRVVEILKEEGPRKLPFNPKKYVFIGFHRLSTAEHVIFNELKKASMAHFYWEYDPALMNPATGNKAGRFISRYAEHFTDALEAVTLPAGGGKHHVEVIGIASNVGQAKLAASRLRGSDTAIVLPAPDPLLPLVASIPEEFEQINVTMGYPLRYSQVSQLYASLAALQIRAKRHSDGRIEFFRHDVMRLLAHPLLRAVCPDELTAIRNLMDEHNLFNLPADVIAAYAHELPVMADLLSPVADPNDIGCVADYTNLILDRCMKSEILTGLDAKAIEIISGQVEEIKELTEHFGIKMVKNTFFHMLERAVFQSSLTLSGLTFDVLQIMGVLETRALGFRNVMMLSMNDSVFPGRVSNKSFIPESLRRAYGLPTAEHFESDAAYHFFRILSNADNLTLIYDSRAGGLRSGEKSRFIEQLINVGFPGVEVTVNDAVISSNLASSNDKSLLPAEVEKTPEIMEKLGRYTDPAQKNTFKLSASALKTYLGCPMRFYLERVENIRPEEPRRENLDALAYGNIIHQTAEMVYKRLRDDYKTTNITASVINDLIDGGYDDMLVKELRRAFNVVHVGLKLNDPQAYSRELVGEAAMYFPEYLAIMKDILRAEPVPFEFIDAEMSKTENWVLSSGINLNFTLKIDRLDRKGGLLRFVDYKTGGDELDFNLSHFQPPRRHTNREGIFQLLTYCYAYKCLIETEDKDMLPLIYKIRNTPTDGTTYPLLNFKEPRQKPNPVCSYDNVAEKFEPVFNDLIKEIFNPAVPFRKTGITSGDSSPCNYCPFKTTCLS